MEVSEIVRATRQGMGMNQEDFSELVSSALASGCSLALVSHWERGRRNVNYEKFFYVLTHSGSPELRDMAAKILAELNPVQWETDKKRYALVGE